MPVTLAKILFNTREQFVDALFAMAKARIKANRTSIYSAPIEILRSNAEARADEALDAIYRDGLNRLEDNIQFAVDEIVREALDRERKAPRRWCSL